MLYNCILYFFLLLILISCGESKPKEIPYQEISKMNSTQLFDLENRVSNKKCLLEEYAIIDIPIDSVSLNYSVYPVYYDADTAHYYITGNKNQHSLDFYDLEKKKMIKRVHFAKDGADGIPNIGFFAIKTWDSIVFLPKFQRQIVIANSTGKVLKRTNISIDFDDELRHSLNTPFVLKDDSIFVSKMKKKPSIEMVGMNTISGFNIYDGKFVEFGPKLPVAFEQRIAPVGGESPHFALVGTTISVRFGLLSVIYQYDMKSNQTAIFPLKSKYQKQAITLSDYTNHQNMVLEVGEKQDYEKSSYQKLMYDPYREVYYSIFVEGIPLFDEKTGKKNDYEDRPISIIIADKDFRYMGEKRLGVGYFRNFLVTKDGLLVSNAHPKNPHYQEDMLSFTLFKLKYQ
jgi:hypothetical protein